MADLRLSKLIVVDGGDYTNQVILITKGEMVIGRTAEADIFFDDRVVSRQHARLLLREGGYFLEDLGSSNGTFLNDQPISSLTPLKSGDRVRLGEKITLVFESEQQPAAETMVDDGPLATINLTIPESTPTRAVSQVEPPSLTITVGGKNPSQHSLTAETITIGRAEDNDITIASQVVSRHHARLEKKGSSYQVEALPGVTNALQVGGQDITGARLLEDGDEIVVGQDLPNMTVRIIYRLPAAARQASTPAHSQAETAYAAMQKSDMTMVDVDLDLEAPIAPPRLVVTLVGQAPQTYTLEGSRLTLGRADDNDIVIPSKIVSRYHATLERSPGGYELVVSPNATNTLTCQGHPVVDRQRLQHSDILRIDSDTPGMMVSMTYESPSEAHTALRVHTIDFASKDKLSFGRDSMNEVVLDVPNVSRFHAQVERVGRRYAVTDLHSSNGTFVNDERIENKVWLKPKDTLRIGPYRFELGEDQFVRYDDTSGVRVETVEVNKWVRKNLNILQNISLVFQPREFIVVVGQSGGGKSTLVDAIAGFRPASHGKVFVNEIDVYRNFDAIRNDIGYVPQKDIIHMELSVYQALDYAAKLRMPRDTSKAERHKRILKVLEDLDLAHRKDSQISSLSGGQQKRVSIGVELLTSPNLFFMDEPTSGLDPGTETAFMHLCRRLTDQGRTIIMVTHATKNVMLADKVVFLARGGYLAWFGAPEEALEYFDQYRSDRERRTQTMEFDQIYAILDDPSKGKAVDWARRYMEHAAYQRNIAEPLAARRAALANQASQPGAKPGRRAKGRAQISTLRQLMILSARNIKILTRDRSSLILMLFVAPLVGMLDLVIAPLMGRAPYDFVTGDAANGAITLFLLTIYCLLVGGLSQMREFVKETEIYKRERLVNLKIFPYVTSKVWVAMLLAFYHALAYTVIHFVAFDMPGGGLEFGLFYVTTVLAVLAGMIGGLLASAIAPAASSAPMIMILLIVPQIVLSGALAPVPTNVSAIASTRWALEGYIGITGYGSDLASDPCWQLPEELRDGMTLDDKEYFGCRCLGTAIFTSGSCNFPGVGKYYSAEIDQAEPARPPALREKPPEPELPEAPQPPADRNNQVAMVQYLNALDNYQQEAQRIQDDYRSQMQLYEADAKIYESQMTDYQEQFTTYNVAREGAVKGAEELMKSTLAQFGFGYVNKDDPDVFWSWLYRAWGSQAVLIFVYFIVILFLIKRKDVI
jgi:ABC transport system ATP-binding/permease protein